MEGFRNLGIVIGSAITAPVDAFLRQSIAASREADAVSKRLNIALRNMGGAAGITRREVDELADSMLRMSNFSDESVRQATAALLRFKGIRGDIFRDTLRTSADMAAAMGTDIGSATSMLGRAMVDPRRSSDMLRRAGITFTGEEREKIKELSHSGTTQGTEAAQRFMLKAIDERMGGAAKGTASSFTQMSNAFNEVQEAAGKYVRTQYNLDAGARLLRDGFLGLADYVNKTNGPFTRLIADLVLLTSKVGSLVQTVGQYAQSLVFATMAFRGLTGKAMLGSAAATRASVIGETVTSAAMVGAMTASERNAANVAASVLPERERATWLREQARRTSAEAAAAAAVVAANDAKYGTRFRPATAFAQAEKAEELKGLAKSQHGRAAVLERRALMAEELAAASMVGTLQGASGKSGIVKTAAMSVSGAIGKLGLYGLAAMIGYEISAGVGSWLGGLSVSDKFLVGGATEKEREESLAAGERAKVQRQMDADKEQAAKELAIRREEETRAGVESAQNDVTQYYAGKRELDASDTLDAQLANIGREKIRLRYATSSPFGSFPNVREDFTADDVGAYKQNAHRRYAGIDTVEAKRELTKAEALAGQMFAILSRNDLLEKQKLEAEKEYGIQIGLTVKSLREYTNERQLDQKTIDTVLKAAIADPTAFKSTVGLGIGPDWLTQMRPDQLEAFAGKARASRGKMGVEDSTDIGYQIQIADTERRMRLLTTKMQMDGELTPTSLSYWVESGARGTAGSQSKFDKAEIERMTEEARSLITKKDQLSEQRLAHVQQVQDNSTWEFRNAPTAVQGTMKGYQDSIRRDKPEQDMAQISKNTNLMADYLKKLYDAMTLGGKASADSGVTLVQVEGL
jgi:hypothetical protein